MSRRICRQLPLLRNLRLNCWRMKQPVRSSECSGSSTRCLLECPHWRLNWNLGSWRSKRLPLSLRLVHLLLLLFLQPSRASSPSPAMKTVTAAHRPGGSERVSCRRMRSLTRCGFRGPSGCKLVSHLLQLLLLLLEMSLVRRSCRRRMSPSLLEDRKSKGRRRTKRTKKSLRFSSRQWMSTTSRFSGSSSLIPGLSTACC
mmetsp:Transcript_7148/g.16362  ORF Transcript_7148/g.16362 Transcript_7148/m.16362 type:complete len:200 (-) Transcript_7148:247-846(-)